MQDSESKKIDSREQYQRPDRLEGGKFCQWNVCRLPYNNRCIANLVQVSPCPLLYRAHLQVNYHEPDPGGSETNRKRINQRETPGSFVRPSRGRYPQKEPEGSGIGSEDLLLAYYSPADTHC